MNIIGFDIGGTKSAVLLARAEEEQICILERKEIPTVPDWHYILDTLCGMAGEMADKEGIELQSCLAGVSCGGPLSADRKRICSPPNLPGWDEVPVIEYIEERLGIPAHMENDADACALAEWKYGAGKGCSSMIFLTFGTGLGCGLILGGRLYRGASGMAGEAGHIRMEPDGPVGYGKRGSLEGFCSGGGISRLAKLYVEEKQAAGYLPEFARAAGPGTTAGRAEGGETYSFTAKELAEAAFRGDPDAIEIFRISGREFGRGLSILIDLLNPERIVAGSIFVRSQKLLEDSMYGAIEEEALSGTRSVCTILPAMLGEQIGDYGAVMAALYGFSSQNIR